MTITSRNKVLHEQRTWVLQLHNTITIIPTNQAMQCQIAKTITYRDKQYKATAHQLTSYKQQWDKFQIWCLNPLPLFHHPVHLHPNEDTFKVWQHVLKKRWSKMYLKCRVQGCALAYVTFHSVRSATAHHHLYHCKITYKCPECDKTVLTPNSLQLHLYCYKHKQFKCITCRERFVYESKMKQHRTRHQSQKLYECFHRSCKKSINIHRIWCATLKNI